MHYMNISVVDTDLQIRVGPSYPDPEIRGGGGVGLKNFFSKNDGKGAGSANKFDQGQIRPIRPGPSCLKGRLTTLSTG